MVENWVPSPERIRRVAAELLVPGAVVGETVSKPAMKEPFVRFAPVLNPLLLSGARACIDGRHLH